jgi:UDP-N-acetylglucosamine 2-epimerase (non-hydrolysing)
MREVLDHYKQQILASNVLQRLDLEAQKYFIVSLHREENVDNRARLVSLQTALNALANTYGMPVIVSTHPRTRKRLDALGSSALHAKVQYMKPFGFHDYNKLQMSAFCAISDSGTIAEESSMLSFPAITPRDAIERPEGIDVGCIAATGLDLNTIMQSVKLATSLFNERIATKTPHPVPVDYQVTNTSERVVSLIISTAKLSNQWDGIRSNDLA